MMMLPFQQAHYARVIDWEEKIAWLYLDSHLPKPIPTVGIGCAIQTLAESLTLGWLSNGSPATPEQIKADWNRVTAMPGSRLAIFYFQRGRPMLPEAAIVALVQKRYDSFTQELIRIFPDFMHWPVPAQTGALDLIWGVGPEGIEKYTHFLAAARGHQWVNCARDCPENVNQDAYTKRNAWRASLFLQAAAQ